MFTTVTFGLALLAAIIIPSIVGGFPMRLLTFSTLAILSLYTGYVSLVVAVFIALAPVVVAILQLAYFYWLGRRALSGKMGKQQMWVAELVAADDTEFMNAMRKLSQMSMKEVMVVAESKEELRKETIDRAAEKKSS